MVLALWRPQRQSSWSTDDHKYSDILSRCKQTRRAHHLAQAGALGLCFPEIAAKIVRFQHDAGHIGVILV